MNGKQASPTVVQPSGRRIEEVFDLSPTYMAILRGPDLIFEKLNARYQEIIGHRDVVGKPLAQALPEAAAQGYVDLMKKVIQTGVPYMGSEVQVDMQRTPFGVLERRFLDVVYQPLHDEHGQPAGIFAHGMDVTDKVLARRRLEESQQQLNLALSCAQMGAWNVDLKTNKIALSEQIEKMLGAIPPTDNFIEISKRLLHSDDVAETFRLWEEAIRNRTFFAHEYRIIRPDGQIRWLYSTGRAEFDSSGRAISMAGVTLDVTDRKQYDEYQRASEARIRTFAEAMPQMAFITDAQGQMIYLNERFYRYLDLPVGDRRGWHWKDRPILHPDDYAMTMENWQESLITGKPYEVEYRLRRHDGEYRWHLGRATAVRDDFEMIVQWYGTNTDIHDQKTLENELRQAKELAEAANRSKSAFLANMSHEIRTPLGAVLGFSELLKESTQLSEKADYAQAITRNGKALTRLIDDILDLSKVEAGRLVFERVDFRVESLLEEVLSLFQEAAATKGVTLKASLAPLTPEVVNSDPARLRQILINLIGNAVKFTADGQVEIQVEPVWKTSQVVQLHFQIKDTGVGLSESQSRGLFEPFSQADDSTTRKFGGSGLGLVLSRRLARALGGDVVLAPKSTERGCTFIATIEAHVVREPSSPQAHENISTEAACAAARVLLVEDALDNQVLVSALLRRAGIKVDIASNGAEGVEKARTADYDVVLMDMQMPVLDGYAATKRLRASGYKKPILALTAHAMSEERTRIFQAGCNAHMTKPLDSKLLVRTIRSFASASST
ncbi:MAG: PAS domain-containing protein [Bdellovibrionales bacterium]